MKTPQQPGFDDSPTFEFTKVHYIEEVTSEMIDFFTSGKLCVMIFGHPASAKEGFNRKFTVAEEERERRSSTIRVEMKEKPKAETNCCSIF